MKKFLFVLGALGILSGCTNRAKQDAGIKSYQKMIINGKNRYTGKLFTNDKRESVIFI